MLGGVLVATLVVAGPLGAARAQSSGFGGASDPVRIGTAGSTGLYFIVGNAICRYDQAARDQARSAAGGPAALDCVAQPTRGSVDNVLKLLCRHIQFAIVQSDTPLEARAYADVPESCRDTFDLSKVRTVISLHVEPVQLVIAPTQNAKQLIDLDDRPVSFGPPGSGSRATMHVVVERYNDLLRRRGVAKLFQPRIIDLPHRVQTLALCGTRDTPGWLGAFAYAVGIPNPIVTHAIGACGARLIGFPSDLLTEMVRDPRYLRVTIGKDLSGRAQPVETLGVYATLITHADVPADRVAMLTTAVLSNFEALQALHPAFSKLELRTAVARPPIAPLHPGARNAICRHPGRIWEGCP